MKLNVTSPHIDRNKLYWFYGICSAFILINSFLIANDIYWANLVPFVLVILLVTVFSFDKLLLAVVFFTPLSINMEKIMEGASFYAPTEPLLFGLMLVFIIKFLYDQKFDRQVLKHPFSIAIIIYLLWLGLTCLTSEMPLISIKNYLTRLWFVAGFFFLATQLFKNKRNIKRFYWLYSIPLCMVIVYTLIIHSQHGFSQDVQSWVMEPFFVNHTIYGACIAMFIPMAIIFWINRVRFNYNLLIKFIAFLTLCILTLGLIFSYCRAAWVSLVIALIAFVLMRFRIKFRTMLLSFCTLIALLVIFHTQIGMILSKNTYDSSNDFQKHIKSISNITTNASNLERINRWNAAIKMFRERPIFGWGPGTYMFQYAPFQHSQDLTIISTNAALRGNAHSEFLGPLAEAGILGSLTFIVIVLLVLSRGINLYYRIADKELKLLVLGSVLGLISYITHGLINNYLDTDKASIPFWGFIAIICAIEVHHSKNYSTT